ncbi:MAG: DUF934 domain-containing protein [Xanthomonadales bacterium]|nr:DUF934 domain-containing protein [Xanthomonadales bacterium]
MALLKNGSVTKDTYIDVSNAELIPDSGGVIISLAQWQEQRNNLAQRSDPLGIVLRSDEKPELIAADLQHFSVIALDFPAFGDGRAYSSARLLRDRYGYTGELRAIGDVLLEQLHFMNRVGFDAFAINSNDAVHDWEIAAADISVWYQPASDGRASVLELRHNQDS